MPSCCAITSSGNMCNERSDMLSYFWFYDPHGRLDKTFHLCTRDSNFIVNALMEKENGYTNLTKALFKQIEQKQELIKKSTNFIEQRELIKQSRINGYPAPKFDNIESIKSDIGSLYNKIKKIKALNIIERNKLCRYCKYPLNDPEDPQDQIGPKYTSVDFKSPNGYRRLDAIFHTECAVTWLPNKIHLERKYMKYLKPQRTGQRLLTSSNFIEKDIPVTDISTD